MPLLFSIIILNDTSSILLPFKILKTKIITTRISYMLSKDNMSE